VGIVKAVNARAGTVTLKHEAIKSLGWSGMTMEFAVREKNQLSALKPEQRVKFELVADKGRYFITSIK
jgi:Cu(I)/Ag(I) efflux system protein CusF